MQLPKANFSLSSQEKWLCLGRVQSAEFPVLSEPGAHAEKDPSGGHGQVSL